MTEIDPELVDDRDSQETEDDTIDLPDYDESQFELSDDYEDGDEE